jgi:AraC-like DNA-binding protein/quercetin dioxygenase-like cupin family protein
MSRQVKPDAQSPVNPEFFSREVAKARRFYFDLKPNHRERLVVVCGGLEYCGPHYAIHRKTFPFHSIEYVAGGSGQLKLRGKNIALNPGMIFSYGPGVPHDIVGNPGHPLVKYFVDFSGKAASVLLKSCKLHPGQVAQVFPSNALVMLFDELIQSGSRPGRVDAELRLKLLECLALKISGTIAPPKDVETLAFRTYQQSRQYIEQHFLALRSLEQIAHECHVDNAYLCRLFRRYDQQSPYQYLLRLKMNYAAERLQQPGVLIKQAAEEVGFSDPFHFSRVFRKALGVSPSKLRMFSPR